MAEAFGLRPSVQSWRASAACESSSFRPAFRPCHNSSGISGMGAIDLMYSSLVTSFAFFWVLNQKPQRAAVPTVDHCSTRVSWSIGCRGCRLNFPLSARKCSTSGGMIVPGVLKIGDERHIPINSFNLVVEISYISRACSDISKYISGTLKGSLEVIRFRHCRQNSLTSSQSFWTGVHPFPLSLSSFRPSPTAWRLEVKGNLLATSAW